MGLEWRWIYGGTHDGWGMFGVGGNLAYPDRIAYLDRSMVAFLGERGRGAAKSRYRDGYKYPLPTCLLASCFLLCLVLHYKTASDKYHHTNSTRVFLLYLHPC